MKSSRNLCIVQPHLDIVSETFLRVQAERLPANVTLVHGNPLQIGDKPVRSQSLVCLALRKAHRVAIHRPYEWGRTKEYTKSLLKVFRKRRPDVVLAQFGPTGVLTLEACRRSGVPLVAHFHGYDATVRHVLQTHRQSYPLLFEQAAAIVVGCCDMEERLISLGAPVEKVHVSYEAGVDLKSFSLADVASAPPTFVSVGRFVEKKAPHLTILAFAKVHAEYPEARLRMIGDGLLLGACRDLSEGLRVQGAVSFLGSQGEEVVRRELCSARCFVQHSIVATNGDSEGTAISILEAGAAGLPVVATRHAGIAESVVHGTTGFLVDEHDVDTMASYMLKLAREPELAAELGRNARKRIGEHYSSERCIARLWSIIESCIETR